MNANPDRERVVPPPLVYLAGILVGYSVDRLVPVRLLSSDIQVIVGLPIVVAALVMVLMSAWELKRAGTSPFHHHATTRVVPHGLYGWSRNPIYVAMAIGCIGVAIVADRIWILAGTAVAMLAINYLVIAQEEAFLEAKFGEPYLDYKRRVRRWI